jgi:hypothetical protein
MARFDFVDECLPRGCSPRDLRLQFLYLALRRWHFAPLTSRVLPWKFFRLECASLAASFNVADAALQRQNFGAKIIASGALQLASVRRRKLRRLALLSAFVERALRVGACSPKRGARGFVVAGSVAPFWVRFGQNFHQLARVAGAA